MSRHTLEAIIERTLKAAKPLGDNRFEIKWDSGVTTALIDIRYFEDVKFFNRFNQQIQKEVLFHKLQVESMPAFITATVIDKNYL